MKAWVYILLLLPATAMAGESGWGSFLQRMFPRTTENVNGAVDTWTAPADGSHLTNTLTNTFAPAHGQQPYTSNGYQQPATAPQPMTVPMNASQPTTSSTSTAASDQAARENLVRCMRMGSLIEMHTALSEQSVESQEIVSRTKPLYANLKCNDTLGIYSPVIKQVDQAIKACAEDDGCQTAKLTHSNSAGGLKQ